MEIEANEFLKLSTSLSNTYVYDFVIIIIGESGYPLEPWLLTPYRNAPERSDELYFNQQFTKGRSLIECVFGVLKGRFRCLLSARELHYAPEKVVKILNVCYALHNICILYKVEVPINIRLDPEEFSTTNIDYLIVVILLLLLETLGTILKQI
ncbi:putative nuclease HARBI1 isoform X1 [Bactrocera tryoni]|uniref:putative nuclease HARBI1 isoform X1 n=1 Tax=Bactrocera tryoni TaxID=59916 RepID=UPI001A95C230|nr:putative nuclease HARBI1 isoform X1 [Bactrocera tryoni]